MESPSPNPSNRHVPGSAEEVIFNDNLQEFAVKIGHICSLETSGKLSPEQAYDQIRGLWKSLKRSKKNLGIGESASDASL
ncbi:MAG: hypothetical protein AAGC44_04700 [Planctomycetota bacterium]